MVTLFENMVELTNGFGKKRKVLEQHEATKHRPKKRKRKNSTSQYYGVYFDSNTNKWLAYVRENGKKTHIHRFINEKDAALAHDKAVIKRNLKRPLNFEFLLETKMITQNENITNEQTMPASEETKLMTKKTFKSTPEQSNLLYKQSQRVIMKVEPNRPAVLQSRKENPRSVKRYGTLGNLKNKALNPSVTNVPKISKPYTKVNKCQKRRKPGPSPRECPWCGLSDGCRHCHCSGWGPCKHANGEMCQLPRYDRRLVCNRCLKAKLKDKNVMKKKKQVKIQRNEAVLDYIHDLEQKLAKEPKRSNETTPHSYLNRYVRTYGFNDEHKEAILDEFDANLCTAEFMSNAVGEYGSIPDIQNLFDCVLPPIGGLDFSMDQRQSYINSNETWMI